MDVNTFKVRLAGLPFLSKSEIQSYQQRVTQGRVDPQTLYREALAVHKNRRNQEIYKKRRELERRIVNLPLSGDDLYSLLNIVDDKSNLDDLQNRAKKIVELRKKKDLGQRRAKLSKKSLRRRKLLNASLSRERYFGNPSKILVLVSQIN